MPAPIQFNTKTKLVFKAILFCVVFTILLITFSFAKNLLPNIGERLAHGIVGTIAGLLTTIIFLKFDKKSFSDIGLKFETKTIGNFLIGVIVGIILMGALVGGVLYFTDTEIGVNTNSTLLNFLLMTFPLIPLAFMEELGFRAYPLEILRDKVGIRQSILLLSILFGAYHIVNGWSVASSFYGPGVWGLVFGLAAYYSKGIAMPTGIHYAVNLTTSAFGETNNSVSLWIIKETNATNTKTGAVDWAVILPSIAVLVFAIICIELFVRRKTVVA